MEELIKLTIPVVENDLHIGNIIISYDGTLDGVITIKNDFSIDKQNEGIDKAYEVLLKDINKKVEIPINILQKGNREVLYFQEEEFILADGGTFNVLKK
jgi:hypothetical protein